MTSKGQITVPKRVREALRLAAGDQVRFRLRADGVVEMQSDTTDLLSLCGVAKAGKIHLTLEQIEETIRRARSGS
jgi:AbrB family looped-hinge helix DNA binding protein